MPGCIIRSCPSRRALQPESLLHPFPRSALRIRSWLERTGHRFKDLDGFIARILEDKRGEASGICSAHFTPDCYLSSAEGPVLRLGAVPTIFPPGEKLISEVVQLRVSRKTRQARLQNAVSGLASAVSSALSAIASKMDAQTQTEEPYPAEGAPRIKAEPGDPPLWTSASSQVVKKEWEEPRMDPSYPQRSVSDRILTLTLEIIFLLTGEDYGPIRKQPVDHVTHRGPEEVNEEKILVVTNKIIELLTGEIPVSYPVLMNDKKNKDLKTETPPLVGSPGSVSEDVAENSSRSIKNKGRLSRKFQDGSNSPSSARNTSEDFDDFPSPVPHTPSMSTSNNAEPEEHLLSSDASEWAQSKKPSTSQVTEKKPILKPARFCLQYRSPTHEQSSLSGEEDDQSNSDISLLGNPFAPPKAHSAEKALPCPDIIKPARFRRRRFPLKKEPKMRKIEHSGGNTKFPSIVEVDFSCQEQHFENSGVSAGQEDLTSPQKKMILNEDGHVSSEVPGVPSHDGEEQAPLLSEEGLYTDGLASEFPVDYSAAGIYKSLLNHPQYVDRSLFCPECGKSFTSKARVEAHLLTHWGKKEFRCSMCPKEFRSQSRFMVHQMTHSGEKPYPCGICGKRFAQNTYLQRHIMGHTGEKPFPCAICGKGFTCKSDLMKHERTHTGARPYPCSVCNKRFTKKSHLNRHMRIHTGEKPFCCPECGRNFGCKSDMVNHQRIHQGIKPFSCADCGKGFLRKQDVLRHQTIHTESLHDESIDQM